MLTPAGTGIPGLASSQLTPSTLPVPVQFLLPHEMSFSPTTLTHFPLKHWASLMQKQPPPVGHALPVLPLQLPNEHAKYPYAIDAGQPPSGHGMLPSEAPGLASCWPEDLASGPESASAPRRAASTVAMLASQSSVQDE